MLDNAYNTNELPRVPFPSLPVLFRTHCSNSYSHLHFSCYYTTKQHVHVWQPLYFIYSHDTHHGYQMYTEPDAVDKTATIILHDT